MIGAFKKPQSLALPLQYGAQIYIDSRNPLANNTLPADGSSLPSLASSAGNNFTQNTATNQPTFLLNQLNGNPVISFDGVNDYLTSNFNMSYLVSPTLTTYMLVKRLSGGSGNQAFFGDDNGFDRFALGANTSYGPAVSDGANAVPVSQLGVLDTWFIARFQFQSGVTSGSKVWVNGTAAATYTENMGGAQLTTTTLGAINSGGHYCKMHLAAFIMIPSLVSDAVSTQIQRYINNSFGLSLV